MGMFSLVDQRVIEMTRVVGMDGVGMRSGNQDATCPVGTVTIDFQVRIFLTSQLTLDYS